MIPKNAQKERRRWKQLHFGGGLLCILIALIFGLIIWNTHVDDQEYLEEVSPTVQEPNSPIIHTYSSEAQPQYQRSRPSVHNSLEKAAYSNQKAEHLPEPIVIMFTDGTTKELNTFETKLSRSYKSFIYGVEESTPLKSITVFGKTFEISASDGLKAAFVLNINLRRTPVAFEDYENERGLPLPLSQFKASVFDCNLEALHKSPFSERKRLINVKFTRPTLEIPEHELTVRPQGRFVPPKKNVLWHGVDVAIEFSTGGKHALIFEGSSSSVDYAQYFYSFDGALNCDCVEVAGWTFPIPWYVKESDSIVLELVLKSEDVEHAFEQLGSAFDKLDWTFHEGSFAKSPVSQPGKRQFTISIVRPLYSKAKSLPSIFQRIPNDPRLTLEQVESMSEAQLRAKHEEYEKSSVASNDHAGDDARGANKRLIQLILKGKPAQVSEATWNAWKRSFFAGGVELVDVLRENLIDHNFIEEACQFHENNGYFLDNTLGSGAGDLHWQTSWSIRAVYEIVRLLQAEDLIQFRKLLAEKSASEMPKLVEDITKKYPLISISKLAFSFTLDASSAFYPWNCIRPFLSKIIENPLSTKITGEENQMKDKSGIQISFNSAFEFYDAKMFLQKFHECITSDSISPSDCYLLVDLYRQKFITQRNILQASQPEKASQLSREFWNPVILVVNAHRHLYENQTSLVSELKERGFTSLEDGIARIKELKKPDLNERLVMAAACLDYVKHGKDGDLEYILDDNSKRQEKLFGLYRSPSLYIF